MSNLPNPIKKAAINTAKAHASNKNPSFSRLMVRDYGNWPVIFANGAAVGLIGIFVGRKLFFHPDVAISPEMHNVDVQNEVPRKSELAETWRQQTELFSKTLEPMAKPIVEWATGSQTDNVWHLKNGQKIPEPLERTDYFQDGLYQNTKAQKQEF